jgi:hypothetical protein
MPWKKIRLISSHPYIVATLALFALVFAVSFFIRPTQAKFGDCDPGYTFNPRSGVGCMQTNCLEVPNAKYSYEGRCICGSSGSETENPLDANKECYFPATEEGCPGCLVKCVHFNEKCPGEFGVTETSAEPSRTGYWFFEDTFSKFMSIGADLLEAATGVKVKEDTGTDAFYRALVILPSGRSFNMRLFHNNFVWNDKGKYGFEFNLVEITPPGGDNWIDEWSIGIGLGSVSKDNVSHDLPGTPISPSVNFTNIKQWFSDQWDGVRGWWRDNVPWFLGGGEKSPIPGMDNQ